MNNPDLQRVQAEIDACARYLNDPALLSEYCDRYGCTEQHARDGAVMGELDWRIEQMLIENKMTAREIIATLLIQIPVRFPGTRVWRHNVGAAHTDHGFVRFGIPGEADITGIAPDGRRIEIDHGRYFTVTGRSLDRSGVEDLWIGSSDSRSR